MKKNYLAVLIAIVIVGLILVSFILGWNEIYCVHTDIDIYTGDIRKRRYIGFIPIRGKIEQTQFSALVRSLLDVKHEPDWHRVTTSKTLFYKVYTYGRWHGAISACELFRKRLEIPDLTKAEQKRLLTECLKNLQKGDIDTIVEMALKTEKELQGKLD